MILWLAAPLFRHRMRVVEPDQPLAAGAVQRERLVDPMRLLRRQWHPRHDKSDPVATFGVHHENLPIEVEQHVEGRVTRLRHGTWLS